MISIQPQYLTLSKLFAGRLFNIPEYQRAYSWGASQRRDLFSDIEKVYAKGEDAGHFMAAIVCLRRKRQTLGTDDYHLLDVVDGQQRLTTLIILLNSIKIALNRDDKAERKLAGELEELLVKAEGGELLLLQTNHDASHHFENFLRTGKALSPSEAKTVADRELLQAIEDCNEFTSSCMKSGFSLSGVTTLLKNRLYFLLHEIDDEKSVYTVFEVLNSRGLDVSWLDRLKSILMGLAFELPTGSRDRVIKDLHIVWKDIYSIIGLHQGLSTEALRFGATLWMRSPPSRPLGEKDAVEAFRASAKDARSIREIAKWILDVTRACEFISGNPRIDAVTQISQARLLAVAINLRDDINQTNRKELMRLWERVSFRIYGMTGYDARHGVGDFVRLAWQIVQERIDAKTIDAELRLIGKRYPIEEAIEELRSADCYSGWEPQLRYFMFRYEEYLSKKSKLNFSNEQWEKIWMVSPSDSIEHIWARSTVPEKHKHRLGNLVLLPPRLNSTLQADEPKKKMLAYRQTGLLIAGEVADLIKKNGWSGKAIESRENALLEWATKEWGD